MSWQPGASVENSKARAAMLGRVRRYFADQNVLETETPLIVKGTATDPHVESLQVSGTNIDAYLHTSPEHAMKRLLASGYPDIYQVCKVFRDGEYGSLHRPEFTMVEWYRRDFELSDIIEDALRLLAAMLADRSTGNPAVHDYRQMFMTLAGPDPLTASSEELAGCLDADDALKLSLGDDRSAWLDLVMATRVAPGLPADRLTVVRHYPAEQAALARLCPADPAVADRFEVFFGPLEIANGFVELTDADEQLARFESDREKRGHKDLHIPAVDLALIEALRHGLPRCAGVALGLDRVLMIAQGSDDIASTLTFDPGT